MPARAVQHMNSNVQVYSCSNETAKLKESYCTVNCGWNASSVQNSLRFDGGENCWPVRLHWLRYLAGYRRDFVLTKGEEHWIPQNPEELQSWFLSSQDTKAQQQANPIDTAEIGNYMCLRVWRDAFFPNRCETTRPLFGAKNSPLIGIQNFELCHWVFCEFWAKRLFLCVITDESN